MNYYGPYEEGTMYIAQIFIISVIVGSITGFAFGILTFFIFMGLSILPAISTIVRALFVTVYGGIGYLFSFNDGIITILASITAGLLIGLLINFVDYDGLSK